MQCYMNVLCWSLDNSEPKVEPSELLQIGGTPHQPGGSTPYKCM